MKKLLALVLSIIFTVSLSNTSFASSGENIIEKNDQITDLNILWDRASRGISDDNSLKFKGEIKDNVEKFIVDKKSTTQLIKKVKKADGKIESEYATTVFTVITEPKKIASLSNKILYQVADSRSWDEYDSSVSVRQVATYYYLKYSDGNLTWIKPQKIDCKWYTSNSVAVTSVKYGAEWAGETDFNNGSLSWVNDSDYSTLSSVSFGTLYTNTIKTIPNDGYVNCSVAGGYVAFGQQCKCTRGTSSWTFKSDAVWQNL